MKCDIPEGELAKFVCSNYKLDLYFLGVPCSFNSISWRLLYQKSMDFVVGFKLKIDFIFHKLDIGTNHKG